jgi:hypothetical protein
MSSFVVSIGCLHRRRQNSVSPVGPTMLCCPRLPNFTFEVNFETYLLRDIERLRGGLYRR